MKKKFAIILICALLISIFSVTSYADGVINLGGANENFVEILRVDNGVVYAPVRLAFTNLNNENMNIKITPFVGNKCLYVSVYQKLNNNEGRLVRIDWSEEALSEHGTGGIVPHIYNPNTYEEVSSSARSRILSQFDLGNNVALYNSVVVRNVDKGQRIFLSLYDLNRIIKFLVNDDNYSVEIK